MAQPIAPDYGQQFLFPPALEDWVPPDHPARFLREFVEQLDLPGLGFAMPPSAGDGRPPYAPSLLLKIWLYGYYHRIRSTRKLEAACRDHRPLLWLAGLIAPDHNSLWRFWRDHKKALRAIFKQTVQVAVQTGCVGLALQALDGTRIEAAASGHSGWSKEYMEKMLAQLDAALDGFELKVAEENAVAEKAGYRLPAGLTECKTLREEIKKGLAQLAASGREHYHPVEPEARRMKLANGTNRYAYNAQAVAALETTTLADGGYGGGADIQAAVEKPMDVLVPPSDGGGQEHPYHTKHFHYEAETRTVTCPRGEKLDYEGQTTKREKVVERYRCHCRDCPVRAQCTQDAKGRQIEVWPHTPVVQAMRQRLAHDPRWSRRGEIIERPFAQIKQHDGFRRWAVWGLENVRTQWALLCATLNLRVIYRRWKTGGGRAAAAAFAALSAQTDGFSIFSSGRALGDAMARLNLVPSDFSFCPRSSHLTSPRKNF